MDLGLQGQGVLVVGATGSIGRAVVRTMLAEGARVAASSRSMKRISDALGPDADALSGRIELDLKDESSLTKGVDLAEDLLGGIDVLVTTVAGDVPFGPLWQARPADWQETAALKLTATAALCTSVARKMVERRNGVIVNVIGVAADVVVLNNPIGSACNAALQHFTRTLAAEAGPSGVRVVGVSPGMTAGPRVARFASEELDGIIDALPMRRIGEPAEIASFIAIVASKASNYLTGEVIAVDGGMTLLGMQGMSTPLSRVHSLEHAAHASNGGSFVN